MFVQMLGDYEEDGTVTFYWGSYDADGASITRGTNGTISVYKDGGTDQSTASITDTEDFDSVTGLHKCVIDLSGDSFYAVDAEYVVVLSGASIDGQTVNAPLAQFTIGKADVYGGRVFWLKESATSQLIGVELVFNGVTLPAADVSNVTMRVFNVKTGADVISTRTMTQSSGEDAWYYNNTTTSSAGGTTELLVDGSMYAFEFEFDHLGRSNRKTWREIMGRDA